MSPERKSDPHLPRERTAVSPGCSTCPVHNAANLHKLGVDSTSADFVIALAGNPNTGKSTLFNALTGLHQHTGNWPGKTVTRSEGSFEYNHRCYKLVDLPGTYSLLATSLDEEIARDFILFGQPDVTTVVVDATRLERNLNLVLQVLEITDRVIVCLNLIDEARRHKLSIDDRRLARDLGIPVVTTAARYEEGLEQLLAVIDDVATSTTVPKPRRIPHQDTDLREAISQLTPKIESLYPGLPNARWIAIRLLDGDERIIQAIRDREFASK